MPRHREDDAAKYVELARIHSLRTQAEEPGRQTKVEQFAGLLEWAIHEAFEGFRVGDVIGVAAAAEGFKTSRSTITQSMEKLVQRGLVIDQPKSPYRVVSREPSLPPPDELFVRPYSLTRELGSRTLKSESLLAPLLRLDLQDTDDPYLAWLRAALDDTSDVAVRRKLDAPEWTWSDRQVTVFRRLRHHTEGCTSAWLMEFTFISLAPAIAADLEAQVDESIRYQIRDISLKRLLEIVDVRGLANGRTRITIDHLPAFLRTDVEALAEHTDVDASGLLSGGPLHRWEYGLFATDPADFFSFSICYIDPNEVHVFIREMDLEAHAAP